MRIIISVLFIACVAGIGNSQIYYGIGVKAQQVDLFSVHETDEDYKYDQLTDEYIFIDGRDTNEQRFLSFGPQIFFGYNFELTNRFSLGAEGNCFLGVSNIPGFRSYMDASIALRGAYLLTNRNYSNGFARIGFAYGRDHNFTDPFYNLVGVNWRIGYEHDFDNLLLGIALEGNVFLNELTSSAKSNKAFLLERRMNTVGVVVYLKFDSFSWY